MSSSPTSPNPSQFVENARSVMVIALPFEPGTMATVLSPVGSPLSSDHGFLSGSAQGRSGGQFAELIGAN